MSIKDQIQKKITEVFKPELLEVVDESEGHNSSSSHFRVLIVSSAFEQKSALQRHQQVYKALGMEIMGQTHAFSQQTYTPTEWSQSGHRSSSPPCHNKAKN